MHATSIPSPRAAGRRTSWGQIPPRVRAEIEAWMGGPPAKVQEQRGGFSPAAAARVDAADGRRFFVKAAGPEPLAGVPDILRQEARVVRGLPADAPAPRLQWALDEGAGGWVALIFDGIDGAPPELPWRTDELGRVLRAIHDLAAGLTPSPLPEGVAPAASAEFSSRMRGWGRLLQNPPPGLDAWSARNLNRLADLETQAPAAVTGSTLLHFDLRADNLLLTPDRVWFVDWPLACQGAAWVDVLFFAPSVTMQGGPPPETLLETSPSARAAAREAVNAALAAVAGFFTHRALLPEIPALPGLRAFQAAQGEAARRWLAQRTGW